MPEAVLLKLHTKLSPGWALTRINFDPIQEIGQKVGGGHSFVSGPFFARLQYILDCIFAVNYPLSTHTHTHTPSPPHTHTTHPRTKLSWKVSVQKWRQRREHTGTSRRRAVQLRRLFKLRSNTTRLSQQDSPVVQMDKTKPLLLRRLVSVEQLWRN